MTNWALIIAIEQYPKMAANSFDSVLPGSNDAGEKFLQWATTVRQVPPENVIACGKNRLWATTGTTRDEIMGAFDSLVVRARGNADEVYIFYSGHGIGFSEEPDAPPIDVLIGSDFAEPTTGGAACMRFQDIKERLRVAMGPGKHFYFIDACRNPLGPRQIRPRGVESVWGNLGRGNATTYVLFSTAPGDVAKVGTGFSAALLDGLHGTGRAKVWVGGKMYVTFESLCTYIQKRLNKDDLDPEKKGPKDGAITELSPIPMSKCDVEVVNAAGGDQFTIKATDLRRGQRDPVPFVGQRTTVQIMPDDYFFEVRTAQGEAVPQMDPPLDAAGVDLYEDRTVRFQKGTPAPPLGASLLVGAVAAVSVTGAPGTEVVLKQVATGTEKPLTLQGPGAILSGLEPGLYKATLRDGTFQLASRTFQLTAGSAVHLDFLPKPVEGAQESLLDSMQRSGPLVDFSETLSNVPDWNLSLWLAVLGASRIVNDPDTFSKLKNLPLAWFDDARPGASMLYVLAGESGENRPACGVGMEPVYEEMEEVEGVAGLFHKKLAFSPGPLPVTYGLTLEATTTILTYGLPNRASLLTLSRAPTGALDIQQFLLPIYSLHQHLADKELYYLKDNAPLPIVRYMSTAQRLFAKQATIEGAAFRGGERYWWDLLYDKWLDPIMAVIACYELIRRGAASQNRELIREVIGNMRRYFPIVPDTEIIASLVGEPAGPPKNTPMLMDGLMALAPDTPLPLPADKLQFDATWTCWRNALELRQRRGLALGV